MGARKATIQAPPPIIPQLEERWIYASELATNTSSHSSLPQSEQATKHIDHNPREPHPQPATDALLPPPARSSRSLIVRFAGWLWSKLSLVSRPQPDTAPNPKRGAQPVIAAPPIRPKLHTEFAIATDEGLKTYAYSPGQSIRYIKRDTAMVLHHLHERGFQETPSQKPSESAQPLASQLDMYFSRPPNDLGVPQIRWLVLTGHNSDKFGFKINNEVTCSWSQLRVMLRKVPKGVLTVVVLACCKAESVLVDLVDGTPIPGLIVIASSQGNERSVADNFNGDYFLNALFTVLEDKCLNRDSGLWEDVLKAIVSELKKTNTRNQNPVVYTTSNLPPSHVCGALMNSLYGPLGARGRSTATSQGGDFPAI